MADFEDGGGGGGAGVAYKDHPDYRAYFKMLKMHLPRPAVEIKMQAEGRDPKVLDTPDAIVPGTAETKGTPAREDPTYQKFFKMLKMGLPRPAVEIKMKAEGFDPKILDHPDDPVPGAAADTTPVKDHPKYQKYFKMLKMGMPKVGVAIKMNAEGLNADVLELDPEKPLPAKFSSGGGGGGAKRGGFKLPKKPVPKKDEGPKKPEGPMKAKIKPEHKMKALFWSKISATAACETVWQHQVEASIEETKKAKTEADLKPGIEVLGLDLKELDALFCDPRALKAAPEKKEKKPEPDKPKEVHLIDGKRNQNASICLGRVKLSNDDVTAALVRLDPELLSPEGTEMWIGLIPTPEEYEQVAGYPGDQTLLAKVERFFLAVGKIPRLQERLAAVKTMYQFDSLYEDAKVKVDTIAAAAASLNHCTPLEKLMDVVLAVGNYMNGSTSRGQAFGFKIDVLTKLSNIKGNNAKMGTLVNYIVRQCEAKGFDEVLELPTRLANAVGAAAIDFGQLEGDVRRLTATVNKTRKEVNKMASGDVHEDFAAPFLTVIKPFVERAEDLTTKLDKEMSDAKKAVEGVAKKFGAKMEGGEGDPVMSFFGVFRTLVHDLEVAHAAEVKRKDDAERAARKEAAKQQAALKKAAAKKEKEAQHAKQTNQGKRPENLFSAFDDFINNDGPDGDDGFHDEALSRLDARREQLAGSDDDDDDEDDTDWRVSTVF